MHSILWAISVLLIILKLSGVLSITFLWALAPAIASVAIMFLSAFAGGFVVGALAAIREHQLRSR